MVFSNSKKQISDLTIFGAIGNLTFLILIIYAIVYALERVSYIDSAWLFFERVNGETFSFPGNRIGAFFSELPLFIAVKAHLPFKYLVYVFSLTYIVLYYFIWRICTYSLKNPAAGLALILGIVVGVREAFIHTVSETQQCFAYSALLFAVIQYEFNGKQNLKIFLFISTLLLVLFSHPLGVFTAAFVIVCFFVERKKLFDPFLIMGTLLILAFTIWSFLHPANPYDATQFQHLSQSSGSDSFFKSAALNFFTMHFTHFYWLPELAGLILIIWLAVNREWLKLAAVMISVTAYFIIACVTFKDGDSSIMLERVFLPAFFMINLALASLITHDRKIKKWIPIALLLFLIINGIHFINGGCLMYKKRLTYVEELVKSAMNQNLDNCYIPETKVDMDKLLVPWALGTETIIYSKFKYDKCISISVQQEGCEKNTVRLTTMLCMPLDSFNKKYFSFSGKDLGELVLK